MKKARKFSNIKYAIAANPKKKGNGYAVKELE